MINIAVRWGLRYQLISETPPWYWPQNLDKSARLVGVDGIYRYLRCQLISEISPCRAYARREGEAVAQWI